MATVREAVYDLLRARGITTVFGNPGSTELPFLSGFPSDFRYVLGLQEAVVVAMADGYAQASGTTALVNLHTAPGVGNAMGSVINAQANKAPMVLTAGQQVRAQVTMEALLTNPDATTLPRPAVKWSYEPPRPQDVPSAFVRALSIAQTPPRGPVFLSIPMDDWEAEADQTVTQAVAGRKVNATTVPDPAAIGEIADRLAAARNPVLVVGAELDACGAWPLAVELAERLSIPVWGAPLEARLGFPQDHPAYQGDLAPGIAMLGAQLEGHDLVLVVGAAVFRYYPYVPGAFLPEGASLVMITSDSLEAARAPVGDALVGDVRLGLEELLARTAAADGRPAPPARAEPVVPGDSQPLSSAAVFATLREVFPDDGAIVLESPSNTVVLRDQLRLRRPNSYFFCAGGGLGFGLGATVGVQLALPGRPVVGVIGEGSAQYAITALWTAASHDVPVTIIVPRNDEYAILKWFGEFEQVSGVPGLDLRGIDMVGLAQAYGVRAQRAETSEELHAALAEAIPDSAPRLIEVPIQPGMSFP
jgi:benzoylformate decarboxylase